VIKINTEQETTNPEPKISEAIEYSSPKKNFTKLDNNILKDPNLSIQEKILYVSLVSYCWESGYCYPGQVQLASELGVSDRSIRNWLKGLEKYGLIKKVHRFGLSNLYYLKDPSKIYPDADYRQ